MVRTCCRFSSSTFAAMHRTSGSAPGATSYSKSTTVTLPKFLPISGHRLLGADQAFECGVLLVLDDPLAKRRRNQFVEGLRRPFGFGKGVSVVCEVDLVAVDTFFAAATGLNPSRSG